MNEPPTRAREPSPPAPDSGGSRHIGPTSGHPPWASWEALLVLSLFILSQPLLSLVGAEAARFFLPTEMPVETFQREVLRIGLPMVVVLSHLIGWASIAWLILFRHRRSFREGLRFQGLGGFRPLLLIGGGMSLQWGGRVIGELIQSSQGMENQTSRYLALGGWAIALLAVMAVVMAPLLEETLFRGILQPALKRRLGFPLAALAVTAVFTATHLPQFIGYPPALVLIFICGGLLSLLREAADSLWPPILFHFGFNLAALLPLLFFSKEMLRGI